MREKEEIKRQYFRLAKVFEDWYFNKLKEINASKNLEEPPLELLKKLNITQDRFYDKYIEPYKNLSREDLEIVFKVLAPELLETYTKDSSLPINCELKLKYDLSITRKQNALSWLLFQVDLLGIFSLSKNLDVLLETPYRQCYYCGKPNYYKTKGQIKKFNLKEVFYHKDKCQKSSNPEKHDNCCYAKWTRRRKTLEKALSVGDNLAQDIMENYEDNNASVEQEAIFDRKLDRIFIDFCEKQYQEKFKN